MKALRSWSEWCAFQGCRREVASPAIVHSLAPKMTPSELCTHRHFSAPSLFNHSDPDSCIAAPEHSNTFPYHCPKSSSPLDILPYFPGSLSLSSAGLQRLRWWDSSQSGHFSTIPTLYADLPEPSRHLLNAQEHLEHCFAGLQWLRQMVGSAKTAPSRVAQDWGAGHGVQGPRILLDCYVKVMPDCAGGNTVGIGGTGWVTDRDARGHRSDLIFRVRGT